MSDTDRFDDFKQVRKFTGAFQGKKALVVLGGPSASDWEAVAREVNPDVLIGANGVNEKLPFLDFWLCTENLTYPMGQAEKGEQRYIDIMTMFRRKVAGVRLVNYKSFDFLTDKENAFRIDRDGRELDQMQNFSFREYSRGLLNGARMRRPEIIKDLRSGTVGLQCLHWAGILGCSEVHTIGYDLRFRDEVPHHWYKYPPYEETRFYKQNMFTTYNGIPTLYFWIDTANYLKAILPLMEREGLRWMDHSHGLFEEFMKEEKATA